MPTKQGGRALKNASTSDRCSFRHNTALPAASTPCSWKTRLAMSKPTVVISIVDGSFNSLLLTARAWHIDAVRGRPPHQILSTRFSDPWHRPARHASVRVTAMTRRGHADAGNPLGGGNSGTGRRQAAGHIAGPAGADVASAVQ